VKSLNVPVASVFYFEQQGAALINAKSSSRPILQPDPEPVTISILSVNYGGGLGSASAKSATEH
jgi:hypothetical protein